VIRATSAARPARAASSSITSPRTRVESTSRTISRLLRRARPTCSTAMSAPVAAATDARAVRSAVASAPDTVSSKLVTG
jgi:hypothetical protein